LFAFFFSSTFAQVIVLDGSTSGSTVSTCNATIYDSGGPNGNYGINEDFQITICSEITGASVILEIINFDTEGSFDELSIYDGTQLTSPTLVADASGAGTITGNVYESSGNCLTITFTTDGSVTRSGFEIHVSCGLECQDYSVDITDINPPVSNQDSLFIDICPGEEVILLLLKVLIPIIM